MTEHFQTGILQESMEETSGKSWKNEKGAAQNSRRTSAPGGARMLSLEWETQCWDVTDSGPSHLRCAEVTGFPPSPPTFIWDTALRGGSSFLSHPQRNFSIIWNATVQNASFFSGQYLWHMESEVSISEEACAVLRVCQSPWYVFIKSSSCWAQSWPVTG